MTDLINQLRNRIKLFEEATEDLAFKYNDNHADEWVCKCCNNSIDCINGESKPDISAVSHDLNCPYNPKNRFDDGANKI